MTDIRFGSNAGVDYDEDEDLDKTLDYEEDEDRDKSETDIRSRIDSLSDAEWNGLGEWDPGLPAWKRPPKGNCHFCGKPARHRVRLRRWEVLSGRRVATSARVLPRMLCSMHMQKLEVQKRLLLKEGFAYGALTLPTGEDGRAG